ncbi:signal peptidase II [Azospirillum sp. YIM DDC1]|uniref:Lipoprotein signal peptidase n=1 Tax=Azospirillum aestuarii TaxID=2802052 RepID=A0ABS1I2L6_9PROT|nr:signal peptidase II [Azospirillum aestuarii]MBK4721345.1 signal peptidase II [Azospirillum aestuarii]
MSSLSTSGSRSFTVFGLSVAALVVVLDQLTKWWILDVVMQPYPRVVEVTPFFNLVLAWNTGVSFGTFGSSHAWMPYVLAAVAFAIVVALLLWLRQADRRYLALALGMVIGGAIGNVIDRFLYGAVADFLDFHIGGWHFWAFNVADSGISVGVALLVLDGLFAGREKS